MPKTTIQIRDSSACCTSVRVWTRTRSRDSMLRRKVSRLSEPFSIAASSWARRSPSWASMEPMRPRASVASGPHHPRPIWTRAKVSRMTNARAQFQMPRMPYQIGPRRAAAGLKVQVNPDLLPMTRNCAS